MARVEDNGWPGLPPSSHVSGRHGRLLPHNPGFPRVRGGSQGAVGTPSSSPALQPGPSGAERLSWSEGWATYGSGSNLCCRLLAACCPHILWVLTPTSSPQGLGNPQTVAIQTCSGTTLHEKINIYIYIYSFLFVFKEGKGGGVSCFLGEQRVSTLSCPLLPLENLWGLGAALSAPRGAQ